MGVKIDPKLRAVFKEIARNIILEDRQAKKHGYSQNTIGAITSALSKAYSMGKDGIGYEGVAGSETPAGTVDWITIPPRAREMLSSMTTGFSTRFSLKDDQPWDIERISEGSQTRWRLIRENCFRSDHSYANGSVSPLIKMGLVMPINADETIFRLTELGRATCVMYWQRSDAGDPTLPKFSLR